MYDRIDSENEGLQLTDVNKNALNQSRAASIVVGVLVLSAVFVHTNSGVTHKYKSRPFTNPMASINCTEILTSPVCENSTSAFVCKMCSDKEVFDSAMSNPFGSIDCEKISQLSFCKNNPEILLCSNCDDIEALAHSHFNPFSSINCTEINELSFCKRNAEVGICSKCKNEEEE